MSIFSKAKTLTLTDNMPFGQHKGIPVEQVIDDNPSYIEWMLEETDWKLDDEAYNYYTDSTVDYGGGRDFDVFFE